MRNGEVKLTQPGRQGGEGAGGPRAEAAVGGARRDRVAVIGTFNLLRWFSLTSFVAVTLVAVVFAAGFSRFVAQETLERDAILTSQFIHSMVQTESEHAHFLPRVSLARLLDPRVDPRPFGFTPQEVDAARSEFTDHIRLLPDLLLATIYAADRTVIWSTNPDLIGKQFVDNEELNEVFTDLRSFVARGHLERSHSRAEQRFVREPRAVFVENYIPLRSREGDVVAVVEVYKEPDSLLQTISRGELIIWGASGAAALAVYLASFWIVRRGQMLLQQQQRRLIETETLVAIGEMSTAVAHSLRNPLATIRTSAELAIDDAPPSVQKKARDIITQVDRLSGWIKDLLTYSRPQDVSVEPLAVAPVLREALDGFATQFERSGIAVRTDIADNLPRVPGNGALLGQALQSVISNAIEAMPEGGTLSVRASVEPARGLVVVISDTGKGMSAGQLAQAFRPFQTTKRYGLGLGLPLVRQIMDRFGGDVRLTSTEGVGTDVRLEFRLS